ncbi:MAG TPA: hypothetical protein VGG14_00945 [Candidatus Sulfotelmatobacter sp.]
MSRAGVCYRLKAGRRAKHERLTAAYNVRVKTRPAESVPKQRHHPIYATEVSGLLVIALLILVFLIVRYWHAIHWSLR